MKIRIFSTTVRKYLKVLSYCSAKDDYSGTEVQKIIFFEEHLKTGMLPNDTQEKNNLRIVRHVLHGRLKKPKMGVY